MPRRRRYGCLVWAAVAAAFAGVVVLHDRIESVMSLGRPRVLTSQEAVDAIQEQFCLPEGASDVYYARAGFRKTDEFVSFHADAAECWQAAEAFAGVERSQFKQGNTSRFDWINKGPAAWGKGFETEAWNPSDVSHGMLYEKQGCFVLIDTEQNRVYLCQWES